ncbi:MAG TPA: lysylphosphatidylglycerol synthase transmembrane domain-containing protein [Acidimicrobiales bacterium]|nr:lysylphosphatidylglycerol synthase transmembrane domain-containing protein [Acidimicrobiales bacterium]
MRRGIAVIVAGIALYVVLPTFLHVIGSWPRLRSMSPWWLVVLVLAQCCSFASTISLLAMVVRTRKWFAVTCALMTGNAVTNVVPAGDAVGAGVQYRMLAVAGIATDQVAGGLAAASILGVASVLVLPAFALPALWGGLSVNADLVRAGELGIAGFVLVVGFSVVILTSDRALRGVARGLQWLVNLVRRRRRFTSWPQRFVEQRDLVRAELGRNWMRATLLVAGNVGLDYVSLLAALRATGTRSNASLVLLAFAATTVIAYFPITPGGIGVVEASLSGLLVLAGVPSTDALEATFAFRLATYWLPIIAGGTLYVFFRRRYGPLGAPIADGSGA